jgi:multiple RNA-binding domain-containing protein 1
MYTYVYINKLTYSHSVSIQSDAVAASMANQYNVTKGEIFDPEAKNVAVRLALGETQIINKTKKYLEKVH